MKEKRDYLEARLVVLVNSLIFEIKIVKKNNLKDEFGMENLKFNGKSIRSERLPNTCNVSFISSQDLKGYLILGNSKLLEASTGAWLVFYTERCHFVL
jgi:hypothetical protein